MVTIRRARVEDLIDIQNSNLHSLPENYQMKYFLYHILTWPELSQVACGTDGRIVGYVLAKMDEEAKPEAPNGHITSLAVSRAYRKLGIATLLMRQAEQAMIDIYGALTMSLHVRETNAAAKHLYEKTLQFKIDKVEDAYYADGENAYAMKKTFRHA